MGIFTLPSGYGPLKLGAYAVLAFAIAGASFGAAFDPGFGIPDKSAQSSAGWRSDNAVARWIFGGFLVGGLYFGLLAARARRLQVFR